MTRPVIVEVERTVREKRQVCAYPTCFEKFAPRSNKLYHHKRCRWKAWHDRVREERGTCHVEPNASHALTV